MSIALFDAITGLSNFQKMLDTVGNNIANMSTPGFKKGRVSFKEMLSQTFQGASAPNGSQGGRNPIQVGLGATLASIDNIYTQGAMETTGRPTDLAITGNGFLIVRSDNFQGYTRNGNLSVDIEGNLVDANGYKIQGWNADATGNVNTSGPLEAVVIPVGEEAVARATGNVNYVGNIDASQAIGTVYTVENIVYDSLGRSHTLSIQFTRVDPSAAGRLGTASEWDWVTSVDGVATGETGRLGFDTQGAYDPASDPVNVTYTFPSGDVDNLNATLDFTQVTQLSTPGKYSLTMKSQDGFPAGVLTDFSIDKTGNIIGGFSNGLTRQLGVIAMADFTNPQGLEKGIGGVLEATTNSGTAMIGTPGSDSRGQLIAGSLELSNVDLSSEFTKMIIAQRAFQANSRMVSTMDQVLEELANLKR